jgi:hypothetical protein
MARMAEMTTAMTPAMTAVSTAALADGMRASFVLNGMMRGCRIACERQKEPILPKN